MSSTQSFNALYELTIPQFSKMLLNLSALLDKAVKFSEAKKIDPKVLLNSRLAPDQFHFIRQVQITCDAAKGIAARLAGQEPPKYEDNEQTVEELKARIKKTVDFLATIKPAQLNGIETKMIPIGFMPGKALPATEYLQQMSIPNFYFHMTTAYSILRHNGIEIGKSDYLGKLNFRDI